MVKLITMGDLKDWRRLGCILAVMSAIQFILFTFIAMIFYPGGYSMMDNFLSHLGQTEANGESNSISYFFWTIATIVAGLGLIPFWLVIRSLFTNTRGKWLSNIGTGFGAVSSPFLMGVGIFSISTHKDAHGIVTPIFFLLFAAAIAIYSGAILLNKEYPDMYAYVGVVFSILIILFVGGVFSSIDILMQKIIVFGFIIWVLFQVTKVWSIISSLDTNIQSN